MQHLEDNLASASGSQLHKTSGRAAAWKGGRKSKYFNDIQLGLSPASNTRVHMHTIPDLCLGRRRGTKGHNYGPMWQCHPCPCPWQGGKEGGHGASVREEPGTARGFRLGFSPGELTWRFSVWGSHVENPGGFSVWGSHPENPGGSQQHCR